MNHLRLAFRRLTHAPLFSIVAVLTLALGIGANTAIFSVINSVLIRPLPYPDEGRVVLVYGRSNDGGRGTLAPSEFVELRQQIRSASAIAAMREWPFNVSDGGEPERVEGAIVSVDFFKVLGVAPRLGRFPDAVAEGRLSTSEVVISDGYWRSHLGARADVIGRRLELGGEPVVIVGVMPPGYDVPVGVQIWRPSPFAVPPQPLHPAEDPAAWRNTRYFETLARIRPGVTPPQARAEASEIAKRIGAEAGADAPFEGADLVTLHEDRVGESRPALLVLLGASAVLLLIACVNLANLLLARAATRSRDRLVRAALGAGRWQLAREQLTESLLLAVAGGGAGLLIAVWGVASLRAFAPADLQTLIDPSPDGRVLAFTSAVALLTGLAFGVGPAFQRAGGDMAHGLREGGRGASESPARRRLRGALAVSEIALASMLAIAAGLLVKAFVRVQNVDGGFETARVLTLALNLPQTKYPEAPARATFAAEALRRISSLPGVASAGAISRLPLNPGASRSDMTVEGVPQHADDPIPDYLTASPGYFAGMAIPIVTGRDFDARDVDGSPPVAIISAATAARFFPGTSPLGKRIKIREETWREVIGVSRDVHQHGLERAAAPAVYIPYAQDPWASYTLIVRASGDPAALTRAVEREIHAIDAGQAVASVRTMDQVVARSLEARRFTLTLIGLFTGIALALAAVGVYGVIAYGVAQRTREVGVRIALGALPSDVVKLVVRDGLRLALAGVGAGLLAALWTAPVLQGLLYAVTPRDPATFAAVAAAVAFVALLASWLPARRASHVDPIVALRDD